VGEIPVREKLLHSAWSGVLPPLKGIVILTYHRINLHSFFPEGNRRKPAVKMIVFVVN
jgi:hypothetical protein